MSSATAFMITDILNYSVNTGLMDVRKLNGINFAAKTGTTNFDEETIKANGLSASALNDLWVVGYDQQYAIGMWYGYEKIDKKYYSTTANWTDRKNLFQAISSGIFEKTGKTFEVPDTVLKVTIEKNTYPYKLAGENTPDDMKITDYFRVGTEPTEVSNKYMKIPNVSNLNINYSDDDQKIKLTWNTPIYTDTMGIPTYNIYSSDGTKLGNTDNNSYTINATEKKAYSFTIKTIFSNYSGESSGVNISIDLSNTSVEPTFNLKGENDISLRRGDSYTDSGVEVKLGNTDVTSSSEIILTIQDKNSGQTKSATQNTLNIDTTSPNEYTITYKIRYVTPEKTFEETLTRTITIV